MIGTGKQKISVLIITLNEELHIKSLLEDLDFADEILIVDSFSTDQTVTIASSFPNVKIIQNKFQNYSLQRNFALNHASHSWVLFMDCDERLTPKLKTEIIATINSPNTANAYLISRTFMFKNEKLRYSGWQSDSIFRLFNKNKCRYTEDRLVHEKLEVEDDNIRALKHKLIHYSYSNFENYKAKMKSYGILKAREKHKKGVVFSFLMMVFHPIYTFLYRYIIRLGFLDGAKGIIICYLNAYSVYARYIELKRITSKI